MTGAALRELFEKVLPTVLIESFARQMGVVQRERQFDIVAFVRGSVIAAGSPSGGLQADAIRNYLESGAPRMARAAFYQRYDERFEALMAALAENALEYARSVKLDLPGILGTVKDWWVVDSSTVKVDDATKAVLPGTGDYAAIKVHKRLSLGSGAPIGYHFSAAREHDSRHLDIDESWRGYGLLADLGYASFARLRACQKHGVSFVMKLKENWKPKVDFISRGDVRKTFFAGSDLDALIASETLVLDTRAVDAAVRVGSGDDELSLRLVGVFTPKGYCFFLTNLPPSIGPVQVGDLYRMRWEVELSFKLDKSAYRLDGGKAQRTCSIKALLHASLISSILTALVVHLNTLATRPAKKGGERTKPPLHAQLVAKCLIQWNASVTDAMNLEGPAALRAWDRLADNLLYAAKDPNWRRRPSVLDQYRGWKKQPLARQRRGAQPLAAN